MDDQVALMEKSYELAAKYMGGQNGRQPSAEQAAEPPTVQKGKKNTATPVRQVTRQVVSSLAQPMCNAEFVAAFSQESNRGFNTTVGTAEVSDRNTIPACVHGAQPFLHLYRGGSVAHYTIVAEMPQEAISPCLLVTCHTNVLYRHKE